MTSREATDEYMDSSGAATTPPELLAMPGYLARRLNQAYVAYWVRSVDSTLTGPQFAVLTAVQRFPGVDQGSVAAAVALDSSTMADVARRLEARGLLVRIADSSDGRRKLLYLSPDAEQVLAAVTDRVDRLTPALLAPLSADERTQFVRSMQRISEHWEGLSGP